MIAVWLSMATEIRADIVRLQQGRPPRTSEAQIEALEQAAKVYDWLVANSDHSSPR